MTNGLEALSADIERRCEMSVDLLQLDDKRITLTALELRSHDSLSLSAACEAEFAAMVRTASDLAEDGYRISAIPVEAVAALYVIAAVMTLSSVDGPAGLLEAQALIGDAVFMLGRAGTLDGARSERSNAVAEAAIEAEQLGLAKAQQAEAEKRRVAGAKGGRPRRVDDAAVMQFMIQWKRDRSSMRGSVFAATQEFLLTDKTIRSALKRLRE